MKFLANKKLIFFFIILIIASSTLALPQYDPQSSKKSFSQKLESTSLLGDKFLEMPPMYWLRIDSFGTYSIIAVLLAFLLGFVSFFMGWNAGGRENKRKIQKSILSAVLISVIARPVCNVVHVLLARGLSTIFSVEVGSTIAGLIVYIIWITYIAAIPVFLYEVFTVTAKEAYPPR